MKRVYFFSMYLIFIVVFGNELISLPAELYTVLSVTAIIVLLIGALSISRGFLLIISLLFLLIGHIIFYLYRLPADIWIEALTRGIGMPLLFSVIPFLTFPLKKGTYFDSIKNYIDSNRNSPGSLFAFLSFFHFLMSIVINIGSIPTMQKLLDDCHLPKKYLSRMYTTGYASYIIFCPFDAVFNMVLMFTGVSLVNYIPAGITMVAVIIITSTVFLKMDVSLLKELVKLPRDSNVPEHSGTVFTIVGHVLILIFLASISHWIIPFSNSLYRIASIILIYSLIWGWRSKSFTNLAETRSDYHSCLMGYANFLPFLISATFLGTIFSSTPVKNEIGELLLLTNQFPLYFLLQSAMIITMVLSLCGVHMMITVTTLALTVNPELIHLSPVAFTLSLLTCWIMGMMISPLVPFGAVVAQTIKEKTVNVTLKHNLKYNLMMLFLAPAVIVLVNQML
jgi:hypothetical protein